MAGNDTTSEFSTIKEELDEALTKLDLALLEAGRSVSIVRNSLERVSDLAEHAGEMEAAISRAREQLMISFDASTAPPLRALPIEEPADEPEPVLEAAAVDTHEDGEITVPEPEPVLEPETAAVDTHEDDEITVPEPEPVLEPETAAVDTHEDDDIAAPAATSRCLRLSVRKKSGNLDLKEVDGSVNENSSVIDVALLDYDGRQATLKLWVNEKSDPEGVRDALLSSLRNHLGEQDTELEIEFEENSAA